MDMEDYTYRIGQAIIKTRNKNAYTSAKANRQGRFASLNKNPLKSNYIYYIV